MLMSMAATHPTMTDRCRDNLFATIRAKLLDYNYLLRSLYQAKKLTKHLGLDFVNIHKCPKRCILYNEEHTKDILKCPHFQEPRYWNAKNKVDPLKIL